MRFTLHYRGPLASDGSARQKHRLRQLFHLQLKELFRQAPLKSIVAMDSGEAEPFPPVVIGGVPFVALVTQRMKLVAELDVTMLRPGEPGEIISHGGDIDNRLKTLFDALRVPTIKELPSGDHEDRPTYCLLEDDKLITRVAVDTDRLLDPSGINSEVILLIRVRLRATEITYGNISLA